MAALDRDSRLSAKTVVHVPRRDEDPPDWGRVRNPGDPGKRVTAARLLDLAALAAGAWLADALLFWSGWSASFWARPEHVFLVLLGIVSLRLLVSPSRCSSSSLGGSS